jgi:DNA recombination-dependent growth factor C
VAFTLTDGLQLTGIEFQDVVFEGRFTGPDEFDGSVMLYTSELSALIRDLTKALDGEAAPPASTEEAAT